MRSIRPFVFFLLLFLLLGASWLPPQPLTVRAMTGTARCGAGRTVSCNAYRCVCQDNVGCTGYDAQGRIVENSPCPAGDTDDSSGYSAKCAGGLTVRCSSDATSCSCTDNIGCTETDSRGNNRDIPCPSVQINDYKFLLLTKGLDRTGASTQNQVTK
jgi:hypothetical protein